jgi:hypothetical protein
MASRKMNNCQVADTCMEIKLFTSPLLRMSTSIHVHVLHVQQHILPFPSQVMAVSDIAQYCTANCIVPVR